MQREVKVWGQRWLIRKDATHAVSYLNLLKGYRCSWHIHDEKYNLFVIITGKVGIAIEEDDHSIREIMLGPGEEITIKPGQWHEFRVYEDSQAIEEMYVEYKESDIRREIKGGKL
jgi:mannose-6-phosphate isomerase-like protein (cupin superfamily)